MKKKPIILAVLINIISLFKRKPDFVIGPSNDPYLHRWWIIPRNPWLNVYLHRFWRSDDDRALHDHPWINASIPLTNRFYEILADSGIYLRLPGRIYIRSATEPHRLVIPDNYKGKVWTLFITGPWQRTWGFHCPKGWVHWKDFVSVYEGGNSVAKGCN